MSGIASGSDKFSCPKSNSSLFTIVSAEFGTFIVDSKGNVIDPSGTPLNYRLSDMIQCSECGLVTTIRNVLTVSPELDSPESKLW